VCAAFSKRAGRAYIIGFFLRSFFSCHGSHIRQICVNANSTGMKIAFIQLFVMRPIISFTATDLLFLLQNRRKIIVRRRKKSVLFEIRDGCNRLGARSLTQKTEGGASSLRDGARNHGATVAPAPTPKAGGIRVPAIIGTNSHVTTLRSRPVRSSHNGSRAVPRLFWLSCHTLQFQRSTYRLDGPNSSLCKLER
jgi:hypothetical protein